MIFVTAYDEYALRAFEVNAVDYLQKPFGAERLAEALSRAPANASARARPSLPPEATRPGAPHRRTPAERIADRAQGVHVIRCWRRSTTSSRRTTTCSLNIARQPSEGADAVRAGASCSTPARFVRIHRSYILNIDRLQKLESEGGEVRAALLNDGTRLPVSRSGYARLKTLL